MAVYVATILCKTILETMKNRPAWLRSGFLVKNLFPLVCAAQPELARRGNMREFKTKTLAVLLGDEDLRLISIWSPTFLTSLLEDYPARRRAEFLRSVSAGGARQIPFEQVWPELQVISCWTHGPSEIYAESLRGLLATTPTAAVLGSCPRPGFFKSAPTACPPRLFLSGRCCPAGSSSETSKWPRWTASPAGKPTSAANLFPKELHLKNFTLRHCQSVGNTYNACKMTHPVEFE